MIVAPLVVADVTRGTGRFNVAQGAIGTATAAGAAVSTTVTGYVVDRFGEAVGFRALAMVAVVAVVVLVAAMPETREPARDKESLRAARRPRVAPAVGTRASMAPELPREVEDVS
jgi:MFS family permease